MRAHGAWANSSVLDREDRTREILDTLFGSRCTVGHLSDVEIAHLASVALSATLYALGRANPEIALISQAKEAQSALPQMSRRPDAAGNAKAVAATMLQAEPRKARAKPTTASTSLPDMSSPGARS